MNIVLLTNILNPYRKAFYDELAKQCDEMGHAFHVLVMSEKEYNREWKYLVDLNYATLEAVCSILKMPIPRISESYIVASEHDTDLRDKKRGSTFVAEPYVQVFSDRLPFEPRMSIFDLIMCEGPAANGVLAACQL